MGKRQRKAKGPQRRCDSCAAREQRLSRGLCSACSALLAEGKLVRVDLKVKAKEVNHGDA
jgi:hypothetical protein